MISKTRPSSLASCSLPDSGSTVMCEKVKAEDGFTPLSDALLTPTKSGSQSDCKTRSDGAHSCSVDSGEDNGAMEVSVSSSGFDTKRLNLSYAKSQTINSSETTMVSNSTEKWLVQSDVYDSVETLLSQLKGCDLNASGHSGRGG